VRRLARGERTSALKLALSEREHQHSNRCVAVRFMKKELQLA